MVHSHATKDEGIFLITDLISKATWSIDLIRMAYVDREREDVHRTKVINRPPFLEERQVCNSLTERK